MPWPTYVDPDTSPLIDNPEAQRAFGRDLAIRATDLPIGALSAVLPDPAATGIGKLAVGTGMLAGLVGMPKMGMDAIDAIQSSSIGKYLAPSGLYGIPMPHETDRPDDNWAQRNIVNPLYPSGLFNWSKGVEERNKARALEIAPHIQPENASEELAQEWGLSSGFAGMSVPIGGVARVIPNVVKAAAKSILPGLASNVIPATMAGASTVSELVDRSDPRFSNSAPPSTQAQAAPPLRVEGASPTSIAYTGAQSPEQPNSGLTGFKIDLPDGSIPPPDFNTTGVSDTRVADLFKGAAWAGAAVAGAAIGHRVGSSVSRTLREQRYNKEVAAFTADQATRGSGTPVGGQQPNAPLPLQDGIMPQTTAKLIGATVDDAAVAKNFLDSVASTPSAAKELQYMTGNINNEQGFQIMLSELMTTGRYKRGTTDISMPAFDKWSRRVAQLPDDVKETYNNVIAYANETDNRPLLLQQLRTNKKINPMLGDAQFRYNFHDLSTEQLQQEIAAGRTNPEIAQLMDIRQQMFRGVLDIAEAEGFIPSSEKLRLNTTHPNYLATSDEMGKISHSFGERVLTPTGGSLDVPRTSWELDKQHMMSLMREIELNRDRRAAVEAAAVGAPHVFTKHTNPLTGKAEAMDEHTPTFTVRTPAGVEFYRNNSKELAPWMNGSIAQQHVGLTLGTTIKKFLTENTTGMMAILSAARAFPLTNIPYQMLQLAMNRPKEMNGGLLDMAAKKIGTGYTGLDPTTPPAVAISLGQDMAARLALGFAHTFDRNMTNTINTALRGAIGHNAVDALQSRMADHYLNSSLHDQRLNRVSGAGGGALAELAPNNYMANQKTYVGVNNRVPQLYQIYGYDKGYVKPVWFRSTNLLKDMYSIVNDAVQSYAYKINKNNPRMSQEALTYEVRDISGDPGIHGSGTVARHIAQTVPYANVSVQGVRRQLQAIKNNPLGVGFGAASFFTILPLAQLMSAWVGGPESIKDMVQDTAIARRGADATFYWHGGKASFKIPSELRPAYALSLELWSAILGAADAHKGEDAYKFMGNVLSDFWDHHITNSSIDAIKHGVKDAIPVGGQLSPVLNAVGAVTGTTVDPLAFITGDQTVRHNDPRMGMPGYIPDASADSWQGKMMRSLVAAVGGGFQGLWDVASASNRAWDPHKSNYGVQAGFDEWVQRFKDNNPQLGMLWSNSVKIPRASAVADHVTRSLAAMKETANAGTDAHAGGFTRGSHGLEVSTGQGNKLPTDPDMLQLYNMASVNLKALDARFMTQINDLKKVQDTIKEQGHPVEVRRAIENQIADEINQRYIQLQEHLNDINYAASAQYGRHIDLGSKIDWKGDLTQFPQTLDTRGQPAFPASQLPAPPVQPPVQPPMQPPVTAQPAPGSGFQRPKFR